MLRSRLSRRTVLHLTATGLVAGVGGCTGTDDAGTPEPSPSDTASPTGTRTATTSPTESPTDSPTSTGEPLRQVTVEDVAPAPDGYEVSFDVEMVRSVATTHEPALVRVTLHNEAAEARRFGAGHRPVFATVPSRGGEPTLLLLSTDPDHNEEPANPDKESPECWRPSEGVVVYAVLWQTEIEGGESAAVDLEVWGSEDNEGPCLPPGTYEFDEGYEIRGVGTPYGDIPEFHWDGFALQVSDT